MAARKVDDSAQIAKDLRSHDRPAPGERLRIGHMVPRFVRAVHPDHGQMVTFTPGEAMPRWLLQALLTGPVVQVDRAGTLEVSSTAKGLRVVVHLGDEPGEDQPEPPWTEGGAS